MTDVTRGMQGILQITEETTEGTKQTNVSIGQLTKLPPSCAARWRASRSEATRSTAARAARYPRRAAAKPTRPANDCPLTDPDRHPTPLPI